MPQRLRTVAEWVIEGQPLADIGTDHALLPAYLRQTQRIPWAVAADVRPGPLEAAAQTIARWKVDGIDLRLGHGLSVLAPEEVATIVIAGMGGTLIQRLLADGLAVAQQAERLVLQPNTEWGQVRSMIARHRWSLIDEVMLIDRDMAYPMMVVAPKHRSERVWSSADLAWGPLLRRRHCPVLARVLAQRIAGLQRVKGALDECDQPQRVAEIEVELAELRAVFEGTR